MVKQGFKSIKLILVLIGDEIGRSSVKSKDIVVYSEFIMREEHVMASVSVTFLDSHWDLSPKQGLLVETKRKVRALVSFEVALLLLVHFKPIGIHVVVLILKKYGAFAKELAYLFSRLASRSLLWITSNDYDVKVGVILKTIVASEANLITMLDAKAVRELESNGRRHQVIVSSFGASLDLEVGVCLEHGTLTIRT